MSNFYFGLFAFERKHPALQVMQEREGQRQVAWTASRHSGFYPHRQATRIRGELASNSQSHGHFRAIRASGAAKSRFV